MAVPPFLWCVLAGLLLGAALGATVIVLVALASQSGAGRRSRYGQTWPD